jgi:hypothetical protein
MQSWEGGRRAPGVGVFDAALHSWACPEIGRTPFQGQIQRRGKRQHRRKDRPKKNPCEIEACVRIMVASNDKRRAEPGVCKGRTNSRIVAGRAGRSRC